MRRRAKSSVSRCPTKFDALDGWVTLGHKVGVSLVHTTLGVHEYVHERCRRFAFRVFAKQPWTRQQRARAQVGSHLSRKIRSPVSITKKAKYHESSFSRWRRSNLSYGRLWWNMTKGGITGDVLEARTEPCSLI